MLLFIGGVVLGAVLGWFALLAIIAYHVGLTPRW